MTTFRTDEEKAAYNLWFSGLSANEKKKILSKIEAFKKEEAATGWNAGTGDGGHGGDDGDDGDDTGSSDSESSEDERPSSSSSSSSSSGPSVTDSNSCIESSSGSSGYSSGSTSRSSSGSRRESEEEAPPMRAYREIIALRIQNKSLGAYWETPVGARSTRTTRASVKEAAKKEEAAKDVKKAPKKGGKKK